MNFIKFRDAVNKQMDKMLSSTDSSKVFRADASKDELWDTYINSFPEGTNPIFKERTEHDCNCCKSFIRSVGSMVVVGDNGTLSSIWDVSVDDDYQVVTDALSKLVKSKKIRSIFLSDEAQIGAETTLSHDITLKEWSHFHYSLPDTLVDKYNLASRVGAVSTNKSVLKSSLSIISASAIETVEELIAQNSLYRGEEHLKAIKAFKKAEQRYSKVNTSKADTLLWVMATELGELCRFKNTVIGTLLVDISEGIDLEVAVKKFEVKVAPSNYKRTSAVITQGMIKRAEEKFKELGFEGAEQRRYAVLDDITINNVIYADKSVKAFKGVFDSLSDDVTPKLPKLDSIKEVTVQEFIDNVLPKANDVEIMFDNKHTSNLVSLIASVNEDAKNMFKWGNKFSWSYNGEVTDSIKERVKAAGGSVEGFMRASLSWFNYDDLDLSIIEPKGKICFRNKRSSTTGGVLDVDENAGAGKTREPVENIIYKDPARIKDGIYEVIVHNYAKRENRGGGFELQFEFDNKEYLFSYDKNVRDNQKISVLKFEVKNGELTIIKSLPSTSSTKSVNEWGIDTSKFHKVTSIMNSPNHWDGEETGNKHVFFMLDGCNNPDKARGFYNEFLSNDLTEHRKVFEVLGSKLKTEESTNQLSGLGFSTTKRDSVICKVSGNFERFIKINF